MTHTHSLTHIHHESRALEPEHNRGTLGGTVEQWNSTNGQLDKFIHIIGAMLDTPIGSSGAVVSSNVAMAMAGRVLPARNDERTRKDYDATGERLDTGKFESW